MDTESLEKVNAKLAATQLRVAMVSLDLCDYVEKNARFMPAEQYRRLVENIRRDGALTSVPFAVKVGDRYTILSGNHRVQAAKDAGLTEVLLMFTEQPLGRDEALAIQLSHNALVGQDDLAILRELYDEIGNLALREYSGLDDAGLGRLDPPTLDPLSDARLEYRLVSIAFLPDEAERAEALFGQVVEKATGDTTWINRWTEYDRLLDVLTLTKQRAGVKNTATAFGLLMDVLERHLDEVPAATPRTKAK